MPLAYGHLLGQFTPTAGTQSSAVRKPTTRPRKGECRAPERHAHPHPHGRDCSPLRPVAPTTRPRSGLSKNLFACVRERNLRSVQAKRRCAEEALLRRVGREAKYPPPKAPRSGWLQGVRSRPQGPARTPLLLLGVSSPRSPRSPRPIPCGRQGLPPLPLDDPRTLLLHFLHSLHSQQTPTDDKGSTNVSPRASPATPPTQW